MTRKHTAAAFGRDISYARGSADYKSGEAKMYVDPDSATSVAADPLIE
jgi:hypothetical protein